MRYAIGEIVLVVIGILIALQVKEIVLTASLGFRGSGLLSICETLFTHCHRVFGLTILYFFLARRCSFGVGLREWHNCLFVRVF